jgi:hypothetical protein
MASPPAGKETAFRIRTEDPVAHQQQLVFSPHFSVNNEETMEPFFRNIANSRQIGATC